MTVYISATTRPAWSQLMMGLIDATSTEKIEHRLRLIAERELARTTVAVFEVLAIDDTLAKIRIHVDRSALFTTEYARGVQES